MSPVLAGPGLLAIVAGAVAGTGLFLFVVAVRGLPPRPPGETGRLRRWAHETGPSRAAVAVLAGLVVLVVTRWRPWWSGCTPGCRCPRRCAGSPTPSPIPAPT